MLLATITNLFSNLNYTKMLCHGKTRITWKTTDFYEFIHTLIRKKSQCCTYHRILVKKYATTFIILLHWPLNGQLVYMMNRKTGKYRLIHTK